MSRWLSGVSLFLREFKIDECENVGIWKFGNEDVVTAP